MLMLNVNLKIVQTSLGHYNPDLIKFPPNVYCLFPTQFYIYMLFHHIVISVYDTLFSCEPICIKR